MLGIVESWLFNKVGLNCKLDDLHEDNIFHDGCVFANILKQYGLIDGNVTVYITRTNDKNQSFINLKMLKPLLEMLHINFDDNVINEIIESKISTIIKVLYELYLCLENKQTLYGVTKHIDGNIQDTHCLDDDVSLSLSVSDGHNKGDSYTLEKPLVRNSDVVKWYKRKYEIIKHNLTEKEKNIREKIKCKTRGIFPIKCTCGTMGGIGTKIADGLPELDSFPKCSDENLLNYKQYISQFKLKQQKYLVKRNIEKTMQNDLLKLTWDQVLERQKEIYNSVFSEIMLKQSQYEKQILAKLIQTETQINAQNLNQTEIMKKIHLEEELNINRDEELKEEFEELQVKYENEHRKVLELHRKLYKEKQELAKKEHQALCSQVIDSLLDIAANASLYQQKYGENVPKVVWDSWKVMFCKSQSIHIPFEALDSDTLQQENGYYDELIENERELDSVVCTNDVNEYLHTCGRWFYKDMCLELGNINEKVLAYIVFRALTIKYPPPPPPPPANIPPFQVSGVLVNINNKECVDKLKILLEKPNIHIFDPDTVLKRSIFVFEQETKPPSQKNKSKTEKKKGKLPKTAVRPDKPTSKKKGKGKKQKSKIISLHDVESPQYNLVEKETQTSIQKDDDEIIPIIRTPFGILGEEVFNVLNEGNLIGDDLFIQVLIEYLKTLDEYNGWLILNYPENLSQAAKLELALTGQKLPKKCYGEDVETESKEDLEVDENQVNRKSKLLSLPSDLILSSPFKTGLTIFGNVVQSKTDHDSKNDLEDELVEPNYNNINNLHTVYKEQNIFQEFSSDSWDVPAVKALARAVLGINNVYEKISVDLFGEDALAKLTKGKGKNKGKKVSTKKTKGKQNVKKNKKAINTENSLEKDLLKVDECKINLELLDTKEQNDQCVNDLPLSPDDENWKFVSLPLSDELGRLIATIWENIEDSYLQALNDILFEIRVVNLRLIPYVTYIKEIMKNVVSKPDVRQDLVRMFIDYYNEVENKVKTVPDVKSYFHCKVHELQQNLWEIMDEKRLYVESNRQKLIKENWLLAEITLLINNHLSLVQNEYDRSLKTFYLINDFYFGILDKVPIVKTNQFERILSKVTQERLIEIGNFSDIDSKLEKNDDTVSMKKSEDNFITRRLLDCNITFEDILEPITTFISQEINFTVQFMTTAFETFYSHNKKEEDLLKANLKKLAKGNANGKKSNKSKKESAEKISKNTRKDSETVSKSNVKETGKNSLETEMDNKNHEKELLFKEWKFALNTEINRFKCQMSLIDQRAKEDVLEFYCYLENVFCNIYNTNLKGYDVDISNTNTLCNYLNTAIEEEVEHLQPITFNQNEFFINLGEDNLKVDVIKEMMESADGCHFTIRQLKRLRNIFAIAGPFGVIRKQPLCLILQDLMLFNADDNKPHLPRMWSLLNESKLKYVMDCLFGPEYAIDWRDFLIYNLEIPFPSIGDILSLRQHFLSFDPEHNEVVSFDEYKDTLLWFEHDLPRDPQEALRFAMIKSLLFDMFRINDDQINYTALLLYFCKDIEQTLGLQKALCLSVGRHVIISQDEVDELIRIEAEVKHSIINLLQNLIDSIVINREGVLIYEIDESSFGDLMKSDSEAEIISGKSQTDSSQSERVSEQDDLLSKYSELSANQSQGEFNFDVISTTNDENVQNRSWVSRIPIVTVCSVMNASLIHQDKTFTLRKQYLNCLEEEAEEDGMIDACDLVSLECIQNLFTMTNKFKISSPCKILEECLNV